MVDLSILLNDLADAIRPLAEAGASLDCSRQQTVMLKL
jgi:hypothetical protein